MTLQALEEKIKTLAVKLEVDAEKVLAWFHTQADDLLLLAEDNLHLAHTVIATPNFVPAEPPTQAPVDAPATPEA